MNDQYDIYHSVSEFNQNTWNEFVPNENPFLKTSFLKCFEKLNKNEVLPFYIQTKKGIVYGHLITIDGKKAANYFELDKTLSLKRWLLKRMKIKFFCFGNTHLSNVSSNSFAIDKISETHLISLIDQIKKSYGINFFLLPDHFLNNIKPKTTTLSKNFKTFNIDPDMVLPIDDKWNSFNHYSKAVQSKYKKRIRKVYKDSKDIVIKSITKENLKKELSKMASLYNNVYVKSTFSGPPFNTDIYLDFINQSSIEIYIYGYYLNKKMVAFSSEFMVNSMLYSYFIGLDYKLNEKFSIYNRILYDTIEHGIANKASKIVYGRTASEFKSTIGAEPISSKSAVYVSNKYLSFIFSPIFKRIAPAKWVQRKPFKKELLN